MDKFVFSTRMIEYDDGKQKPDYLFSGKNKIKNVDDTKLCDIFVKEIDNSVIIEYLKGITEEVKALINVPVFNGIWDNLLSTQPNVVKNPGLVYSRYFENNVKLKELIRTGFEQIDSFKKYGYYWQLNNVIYAVYQLDKPNSGRVKDLVDQFKVNMNKIDNLYLLLHDKDVPNESGVVKVVDNLDKYNYKQDVNDPNVKLVLFNHTNNWVVSILESKDIDSIEKIIKGSIDNAQIMKNILKSPQNNNTASFKKLCIDGGVDSLDDVSSTFNFEELDDCNVCEDKTGVLLNELMHGSFNINRDENPNNPFLTLRDCMENIKDKRKPLIIKLYKNFFEDWEKSLENNIDKEKIRKHPNNIALDKNLKTVCSFFNNSSIWIRIVDINDN